MGRELGGAGVFMPAHWTLAQGSPRGNPARLRSRRARVRFAFVVELGQLLMVLVAYAVVHLPIPQRYLGRARRPALYVVGAVAAYWSWLRIAAIVF